MTVEEELEIGKEKDGNSNDWVENASLRSIGVTTLVLLAFK
jgi:hypothetical protein